MKTYRDRLIAGLLNLGFAECLDEKSKYRSFRKLGNLNKIFVGKMGALRAGLSASCSHSIGDPSNQTPKYLVVLKAAEGTRTSSTQETQSGI